MVWKLKPPRLMGGHIHHIFTYKSGLHNTNFTCPKFNTSFLSSTYNIRPQPSGLVALLCLTPFIPHQKPGTKQQICQHSNEYPRNGIIETFKVSNNLNINNTLRVSPIPPQKQRPKNSRVLTLKVLPDF